MMIESFRLLFLKKAEPNISWREHFFKKRICVQLWQLSWPLMISNLGVPLLGLTDSFAAGHLGKASDLGAVTLGASLINVVFWGFGFLRMGTTALIAQAFGDEQKQLLVLLRAFMLALILSLFIWVLSPVILYLILPNLGAPIDVIPACQSYFLIVVMSAPFHLANLVSAGWLVGKGQTKMMLKMTTMITLSNIVLNLLFVFGFGFGVAGIAMATVMAQCIGFIFVSVPILSREIAKQDWPDKNILFTRQAFLRLLKMNSDLWLRTMILLFGFFLINISAGHIGTIELATTGVLLNLFYLGVYFQDGLAVACETLAGRMRGQRKVKELIEVSRVTFVFSIFLTISLMVILFLICPLMIDFITDIDDVRHLAKNYYLWVVFLPISSVWCFVFDGLFLGCSETRLLLKSTLISTVIYSVVLVGSTMFWGLGALWASLHLLMWLRALSLAKYYLI
ncbi:MAG: MATE family efflux transporter, partial [Pseudomonadota bacterium]